MPSLLAAHIMRISAWLGVVALAVASWTPAEDMIRTGMGNKIEHMIAYLLTTFAFTQGYPERSPWQFMTTLSICATLLEVGQSIVPGRHAAPSDLAAGVIGAFVASMVVVIWRLRNSPTSPQIT